MKSTTALQTETQLRDSTAAHPKTLTELSAYIESLVEREHDYGTCVYAMSLSAVAALNYAASKLGVSGFQASCADLDILRRTRGMKGPFIILKAEDALYPQCNLYEKLDEATSKWTDWLGEEAGKKLREGGRAHPAVLRHWLTLATAAGKNGFDASEIEAKAAFLENKFTVEFISKHAEQFKRFGLDDIHTPDAPVSIATSCKEGGACRLNASVSLMFGATIEGVKVYWFVDTERAGSNGSAKLNIDFELLDELAKQAKGGVQETITKYIATAREASSNPDNASFKHNSSPPSADVSAGDKEKKDLGETGGV